MRRAGFALLATLAVHDKAADNAQFMATLPLIEAAAGDERNFVKKAVNWALRNIGKRNPALNQAAIDAARRVQAQGSRSARWIAADASPSESRAPEASSLALRALTSSTPTSLWSTAGMGSCQMSASRGTSGPR